MDFSFKLSDILLHEPTQQSQRSKPKVKAFVICLGLGLWCLDH